MRARYGVSIEVAGSYTSYLGYTVKKEKERLAAQANGAQSLMILEGLDIYMAIAGNAGPSGRESGGGREAARDSGEADAVFTIHVFLRQGIGESEIEPDMRVDENEARSGQGATAEGGPSNTQDTTG